MPVMLAFPEPMTVKHQEWLADKLSAGMGATRQKAVQPAWKKDVRTMFDEIRVRGGIRSRSVTDTSAAIPASGLPNTAAEPGRAAGGRVEVAKADIKYIKARTDETCSRPYFLQSQ